jgi:hypothetical protein
VLQTLQGHRSSIRSDSQDKGLAPLGQRQQGVAFLDHALIGAFSRGAVNAMVGHLG